jgi:hypothetical protein
MAPDDATKSVPARKCSGLMRVVAAAPDDDGRDEIALR